MEAILVPLIVFGVIPFTVWIVSHNRAKNYSKRAEALVSMANTNTEITPEIIESLNILPIQKHRDLRMGLFLIAISIATLYSSNVVPDEEARAALSGVTAFPLLLGVAYIGLWVFVSRKDN